MTTPPATQAQTNVRTWLLGLPFDAVTLQEVVDFIHASARTRQRLFLSTVNVNWVVACAQDAAMRHSVLQSDLSVADGTPLVWLSRWAGAPLPERVAGSEVFAALRKPTTHPPLRVYFFGGPPGVADAACAALNAESGGCVAVGAQSPGYGDLDSMSQPEQLERINAAKPDFVVVSLGARKGQAWIQRNRQALEAPVIAHLGAVVNFVAGAIPQAPGWVGRAGLEWIWRIAQEPVLWRRYAADGFGLLRLMARHGVRWRYREGGAIERLPAQQTAEGARP
jgi:N-acetylglucosaminyldiphosphoundecaprenol N-acetyl-beta-D-mannosaminyltransferase